MDNGQWTTDNGQWTMKRQDNAATDDEFHFEFSIHYLTQRAQLYI